ncbi:MAG: alpha/beta hydrolase [Defluviitaleaceae bacterium]|nr:alpha/beta hydrolase [Defluviitaleaceae bacterium]
METIPKNLVILFPGGNYTTEKPLLHFAEFKYRALKGYDCVKINYGDCLKKNLSPDEIIENIKSFILPQIEAIDFSSYDDIVFVSKSLGTIIAGWLTDKLNISNIRHIYLTPVEQTLPYITNNNNISMVVSGTKDKQMQADVLKNHCQRNKVSLKLIEGANHHLEIPEDINASIEILKIIAELYS